MTLTLRTDSVCGTAQFQEGPQKKVDFIETRATVEATIRNKKKIPLREEFGGFAQISNTFGIRDFNNSDYLFFKEISTLSFFY